MDALDMQDAAMQGVARYNEWKTRFLADFKHNLEIGNLAMAFAMMPPAMKEQLKQEFPDQYREIVDYLKK